MDNYNFDEINNRYNTGCYRYDRIKAQFSNANDNSIVLTLADMDFKSAPSVISKLTEVAKNGIFGYMTEYYQPYQDACKWWFKTNFDLDLKDNEIIFSNGTIEGIRAVIKLYSKESDYVAISRPIYGHFTSLIEEEKRIVKDIPLINNNGYYTFDFESIEKELTNKSVKIYLLCSPHNPVGRVWRIDELERLASICKKTNTLLVSDEVHSDIRRNGVVHTPILKLSHTDNIIMFTSTGKTFNTSGLQLSNMIVKDPKIIENIRNNFDVDISVFAQAAVLGAYNSDGYEWKNALNEYLDKNIDYAYNFITNNMPYCHTVKPEGTYFLWLDFHKSNLSDEQIHDIIYNKANVFLQDGTNHDPLNGMKFQRLPLAVPLSVVKEALNRIKTEFDKVVNYNANKR